MDKLKALLLPLALVFGAIAVFEFGARYGASNVRAVALASQLQTYLNFYVQARGNTDEISEASLEKVVDNHIATAALQRDAWFLKFRAEPRATLDKALGYALSVRGDEVLEHFSTEPADDSQIKLSPEQLSRIRAAVDEAREELVENAPSAEEFQTSGEQ